VATEVYSVSHYVADAYKQNCNGPYIVFYQAAPPYNSNNDVCDATKEDETKTDYTPQEPDQVEMEHHRQVSVTTSRDPHLLGQVYVQ
jgi:hypothetical protein